MAQARRDAITCRQEPPPGTTLALFCREFRVVGGVGVKMIGMAGARVLRPFGGALIMRW
jgi:hypothetical protein